MKSVKAALFAVLFVGFVSASANGDDTFIWGYILNNINIKKSVCANYCWAACAQAVLCADGIEVSQCSL